MHTREKFDDRLQVTGLKLQLHDGGGASCGAHAPNRLLKCEGTRGEYYVAIIMMIIISASRFAIGRLVRSAKSRHPSLLSLLVPTFVSVMRIHANALGMIVEGKQTYTCNEKCNMDQVPYAIIETIPAVKRRSRSLNLSARLYKRAGGVNEHIAI